MQYDFTTLSGDLLEVIEKKMMCCSKDFLKQYMKGIILINDPELIKNKEIIRQHIQDVLFDVESASNVRWMEAFNKINQIVCNS